jgi:hypothetical protein
LFAFILALIPVLFASSIVENKLLSLLLAAISKSTNVYRLKYLPEKSRFEFYLELCFYIGAKLPCGTPLTGAMYSYIRVMLFAF